VVDASGQGRREETEKLMVKKIRQTDLSSFSEK